MAEIVQKTAANLKIDDNIVQSVTFDGLAQEQDLENYLNKNTGGEVSGNIAVGHAVHANGENSFAGGIDTVVEGSNSFAFGQDVNVFSDGVVAFGRGVKVGLKVWYYKAIDFANNTIYLSNARPAENGVKVAGPFDGEYDSSFESGFETGNKLSFVNNQKYENVAVIQEIDHNKIIVDKLTDAFPSGAVDPIIGGISNDDYSVYSTENPNIQNAVDLGSYAFACGKATQALNEGAHAEGLSTVAYGRMSHAEGRETQAGYAAHAEGTGTHAAALYSHAQGFQTSALGYYSHSGGEKSLASGHGSFAHGHYAKATGKSSVAIGGVYQETYGGTASGKGSMAFGVLPDAKDDYSFVWSAISSTIKQSEGIGTFNLYPEGGINGIYVNGNRLTTYFPDAADLDNKLDKKSGGCGLSGNAMLAYGSNAFAKGNQSIAIGVNVSAISDGKALAYGNDSSVQAPFSFGFGEKLNVSGAGKAVAIGNATSATNSFAYAFGKNSIASGSQSRAIGLSSKATGGYSCAFGEQVSATGLYSMAFGKQSKATASYSHAEGLCALATGVGAFAYGGELSSNEYYPGGYAAGTGSFAGGSQTSAIGREAFAHGYKTFAEGNKSIAFGNLTKTGHGAFACGDSNIASGLYSFATGYMNNIMLKSDYSFAAGSSNTISGNGGIIKSAVFGTGNSITHTGTNTKSFPSNIFVTGHNNKVSSAISSENILVGGYGNQLTLQSNNNTLVYGNLNKASAGMCVVEGELLSANNAYSCMFGRKAKSTHEKQFIWNAGGNNQAEYIPETRGGTFNINPIDGLSGFYIGNQSMASLLAGRASKEELAEMYLSAQTMYNGFILGCVGALSAANAVSSMVVESQAHPGKNTLLIVPTGYLTNSSGAILQQVPAAQTFVMAVGALISAISLAGSQYYDGQLA